MLLRMAALGGLGYAAYNYYTKNREEVNGTLRRLAGGSEEAGRSNGNRVQPAGGPISGDAQLAHAGEGPVG